MLLPLPDAPRDAGPAVYVCSPRPPAPVLGTMVASSSQEAKNFLFFQMLCLMFGEGDGGLFNWPMHCLLQLDCLLLDPFSLPLSTLRPSRVPLWARNVFSEDEQGQLFSPRLSLWRL